MKPHLSYTLAMAAGRDAGDRAMRAGGRSAWSVDDANAAADVANKLLSELLYWCANPATDPRAAAAALEGMPC